MITKFENTSRKMYHFTAQKDKLQTSIIWSKFPFNNKQEPSTFVCWEESITHNKELTSHSASVIVAKEVLYQSQTSG